MNALLDHVWGVSPAQDRVWAQVTGLVSRKAVSRQLMVLQAFLDDSYTKDGVFVLAGFIASAETWVKFSSDWEELLPYGTLDKYGRYHFKMSEMAEVPERFERAGAFYRVIEKHNLLGLGVKINISELRRAIGRVWSLQTRIYPGIFANVYTASFWLLMRNFHAGRNQLSPFFDENDVVDFIFDHQREKKIILDGWDAWVEAQPGLRHLYGATPRFEDDTQFLPLQAADLLAWWHRRSHESGNDNNDTMNISFGRNWKNSGKPLYAILLDINEDQLAGLMLEMAKTIQPGISFYDDGSARNLYQGAYGKYTLVTRK